MNAVALLFMLGGQIVPPDAPPVVHEQLLDDVGGAGFYETRGAGMTVRHRTLPSGSFAEVTALDSGKTVVLLVEQDPSLSGDEVALLSESAAEAVGVLDQMEAKIRIRPAVPSPVEQAAIRAGNEVTRLPAPPALLAALKRRLPSPPKPAMMLVAATTIAAPKPVSRPTPPVARPAATGRWFVQVAALSDAARAATLAKTVDGVVRSAGRLYRVQSGPFTTRAAAETARAAIARRGFADARIIAQD
jgi:rare lipoprotein A